MIEKTIRSIKRKRKKNKAYTPFFIYFLELLEQLIKSNEKFKSPKLAQEFAQKCQTYEGDPVLNLLKEYSLKGWEEMIRNGCTFAETKKIS